MIRDVDKLAPGLLLFGSDGGGEAFAFDARRVPMRVVSVPFIGMALADAHELGSSFSAFIQAALIS